MTDKKNIRDEYLKVMDEYDNHLQDVKRMKNVTEIIYAVTFVAILVFCAIAATMVTNDLADVRAENVLLKDALCEQYDHGSYVRMNGEDVIVCATGKLKIQEAEK
jgi:hypothetical protein